MNQQTSQPMRQSAKEPTNQPTSQPINQSTNQPANHPANQSTNQPTSQAQKQANKRDEAQLARARDKHWMLKSRRPPARSRLPPRWVPFGGPLARNFSLRPWGVKNDKSWTDETPHTYTSESYFGKPTGRNRDVECLICVCEDASVDRDPPINLKLDLESTR